MKRRELGNIGVGYLDIQFLVQADDEVQKIHRVDVHLLTQVFSRIYRVKVDFGGDIVQCPLYDFSDVTLGHGCRDPLCASWLSWNDAACEPEVKTALKPSPPNALIG